jgi:hypothetical protein
LDQSKTTSASPVVTSVIFGIGVGLGWMVIVAVGGFCGSGSDGETGALQALMMSIRQKKTAALLTEIFVDMTTSKIECIPDLN